MSDIPETPPESESPPQITTEALPESTETPVEETTETPIAETTDAPQEETETPEETVAEPVAESVAETTASPPDVSPTDDAQSVIDAANSVFRNFDKPPPQTTTRQEVKTSPVSPPDLKSVPTGNQAPQERRGPGRPPGSRNRTPEEIAKGVPAAGPTATPSSPAKTNPDIPDKYKSKGGKGKKGKRQNYYLREATANATDEDKKFVKENYTDVLARTMPEIPAVMRGILSGMALHTVVYFKDFMDNGIWISAIGAGVPLAAGLAREQIEKQNEKAMPPVINFDCPSCGATSGKTCRDASGNEYPDPRSVHSQRTNAARKASGMAPLKST